VDAAQDYHDWFAGFVAEHKDGPALTAEDVLVFHEAGFKLIREVHEIAVSIFHEEPYASRDDATREAWTTIVKAGKRSRDMLLAKGEELRTRRDVIATRSVLVKFEQRVASVCEEILQTFLEENVEEEMAGHGLEVVLMCCGTQDELAKLDDDVKKSADVCELLDDAIAVVAKAVATKL
jgi:hypothetical protein